MSDRQRRIPDDVRAAIRARAAQLADEAPPLQDWQIQILAPLLGPRREQQTRRRRAA